MPEQEKAIAVTNQHGIPESVSRLICAAPGNVSKIKKWRRGTVKLLPMDFRLEYHILQLCSPANLSTLTVSRKQSCQPGADSHTIKRASQ